MSIFLNNIRNWVTKPTVEQPNQIGTQGEQPLPITVEQPLPLTTEQPQTQPESDALTQVQVENTIELAPQVTPESIDVQEVQQHQTHEDPTIRSLMTQPQILSGLLNQPQQEAPTVEHQPTPEQYMTKINGLKRSIEAHVEQDSAKLNKLESKMKSHLLSKKEIDKLQKKSTEIEKKLNHDKLSRKKTQKLDEKLNAIEKKCNKYTKTEANLTQEKLKLQGKIEKHHARDSKKLNELQSRIQIHVEDAQYFTKTLNILENILKK